LPDASVQVLQGIAFVLILASEALRGFDWCSARPRLRGGPAPAPLAEKPAPASDVAGEQPSGVMTTTAVHAHSVDASEPRAHADIATGMPALVPATRLQRP
jgi:hypothetical protein